MTASLQDFIGEMESLGLRVDYEHYPTIHVKTINGSEYVATIECVEDDVIYQVNPSGVCKDLGVDSVALANSVHRFASAYEYDVDVDDEYYIVVLDVHPNIKKRYYAYNKIDREYEFVTEADVEFTGGYRIRLTKDEIADINGAAVKIEKHKRKGE